MNDVFVYFDAWEPLFKARKAKGLDKWAKLQPLAEKLAGKSVKAISFTCSHPSHAGEPVKHLLGSVEGNLHFMLGYGNPAFHLAPYHWQVIDPNIAADEAEATFARMHHPSNPVLWSALGIDAGDEGDTEEGEAHPLAKQQKAKKAAASKASLKAKSPTGSYTCVPDEGLVYGDHNGHVYRWDLVKDSFFSAFNPEVADEMNAQAVRKSKSSVRFFATYPDVVKKLAKSQSGLPFVDTVYPLVKSRVPHPGTIVPMSSNTAESVFAVVTDRSLDFYDREGNSTDVRVFDRTYKSFDLTREGNVPPSAVLSFVTKYFGVNASLLAEASEDKGIVAKAVSSIVYGEPTPGFDLDLEERDRRVVVKDGHAYRVEYV